MIRQNNQLRNALGFIFLCACVLLCGKDVPEVSLSPEVVTVGSTVTLTVRSSGKPASLQNQPDIAGITWLRGTQQSSSMSTVNGKTTRSTSISYRLMPLEAKTYQIPPLTIKWGNQTFKTEPMELKVLDASAASAQQSQKAENTKSDAGIPLDEAVYSTITVLSDKKTFYIGEEVPVEIKVFTLNGVRMQMNDYPQIEAGDKANIVFHDYSKVNRENPTFDAVTQERQQINGRNYQVFLFRTAFRALSSGTFPLTVKTPVSVIQRQQKRASSFFDDDFFGGFSMRDAQEKMLICKAPELTFKPLPPAPKGISFCGLVGTWQTRISLDGEKYEVGTPLTLKYSFNGKGTLETLSAPTVNLPGFRVYPPEIEKAANGKRAEIRYLLIPTQTGDTSLNVDVATFSPAAGEYINTDFSRNLTIAASSSPLAAPQNVVVGAAESPAPTDNPEVQPKPANQGTLYLHKLSPGVSLPLKFNAMVWGAVLLILGLAFYLFTFLIFARSKAMENDPALRRRLDARKQKGALLKQLKETLPDEICAKVAPDLNEYLNDMLNLPPGATLSDAAGTVRKEFPEFADLLSKLAEASWMPNLKESFDSEFKSKLIRALSKFSMIAILLVAGLPAMLQAEDQSNDSTTIRPVSADAGPMKIVTTPASEEEAMTAYDSGKFAEALKFYSSKLDLAKPSPAILYNMGNCLYQMGDYAKALVCYERALRLQPRGSDILENLNLTRRKLFLPERYRIEAPADAIPYLRDMLRTDEWIVFGAFGVLLILVAFGLRNLNLGKVICRTVGGIGIGIVILSVAALFWQDQTSYSEKYAIVTVRNAPLYSLPSDQSGKPLMRLKAGEEVSVEEKRLDWLRIRVGDTEGWIRTQDLEPLWE